MTFCQTALDAANAMVTVPGVFESFGHDYRADTARFVRDGFHLPSASEEQMERIEAALRSLELDRSERIKASNTEAAPPAPSEREVSSRPVSAGVPLKVEKTKGGRLAAEPQGKTKPWGSRGDLRLGSVTLGRWESTPISTRGM